MDVPVPDGDEGSSSYEKIMESHWASMVPEGSRVVMGSDDSDKSIWPVIASLYGGSSNGVVAPADGPNKGPIVDES